MNTPSIVYKFMPAKISVAEKEVASKYRYSLVE